MGTPSASDIGPGVGAFIAFFVLAVLLWLLMRNMNGRMRRMAYRERERIEALEAQERAAAGEPDAAQPDTAQPGTASPETASPDTAQPGEEPGTGEPGRPTP